METMKASGCKKVPPHTYVQKLPRKRCKNAPKGGLCAKATEVEKQTNIITESGKTCSKCDN